MIDYFEFCNTFWCKLEIYLPNFYFSIALITSILGIVAAFKNINQEMPNVPEKYIFYHKVNAAKIKFWNIP